MKFWPGKHLLLYGSSQTSHSPIHLIPNLYLIIKSLVFQVDVFHNTSTFSAICTVFIEMKLLLLLLLKISNAIKQQTPEKTARTGKIILTVFILVAAICISIRKQM